MRQVILSYGGGVDSTALVVIDANRDQVAANAIGQACEQIESGYPHCAANRLRQLHAEIMKESRNDGHH